MARSAIRMGPGMELPIMHESDRYELVKDIGSGNFGVARLMRDKHKDELVVVKYIERGDKIDENVQREIINHRSLRHLNIVRFKEVVLTPTHLAIVMEYAAGGELFERICNAGRFSEDETRFFFQRLISGLSYCHSMQICHRDLKLENTLLDGSTAPRLKICDFGYSKIADVWSCGVTIYVMLVGAYPLEDPDDPKNFHKTIRRIIHVQYSIPDYVHISPECHHLLSRIFGADTTKISLMRAQLTTSSKNLINLCKVLMKSCRSFPKPLSRQRIKKISIIIWLVAWTLMTIWRTLIMILN